MSEWWTYSLSDFLLFSSRTYDRLLELYNAAVWPMHLVTAGAGIAAVGMLARRPAWPRVAALVLGACWAWVAWAFHLERYAQINWAAPWFAAAFALQAALLACAGLFTNGIAAGPDDSPASRTPLMPAMAVVVGYPVLSTMTGRSWTASEAFGIAPDPTALATLLIVVNAAGAVRWVLAIIPIAWCAVGAATLLALESPLAYVVIALVLAALAWPLAMRRAVPRAR